MQQDTANFFHENKGELFTIAETPFDRAELVRLVNDSVDPVQQVAVDGERYYGVIDYRQMAGWYKYTRWDDRAGEVPIGVCAKCVAEQTAADEVARTLGDSADDAREKFERHYDKEHTVDPESVAVETGATLLSGTTISGNEAIHPGMDGDGSGVDADFVQGEKLIEKGVYYKFTEDNNGNITFL